MSLQLKIETIDIWDIDGIEEVTMHYDAIIISEEDALWKFIKSQVEIFLEKLVNGRTSNDKLID